MTKKISLFLVLVLSLMTFGLIGSNHPVKADADATTVTLHKVLFGLGEMPAEKLNSGSLNTDYDDHERLPGVTFEVYDMTDDFHALKSAPKNLTEEAAKKVLAESGPDGSPVATKVTNENGEATFNLGHSDGRYKAYLFHESAKPEGVSEQTSDFVVVLPFNNLAGERLNHIHLYPKNESEEVPIDKEVVGDISYNIGEPIAYEIKTNVPNNPGVYSRFSIKDSADSVLLFDSESLIVTIGGTAVNDIYEMVSHINGFVLNFNIEQLKNFGNQEIVVRYEMALSEDALPDVNYFNEATVEYGNHISMDREMVLTGGYPFIKVDYQDETRTLAGAEFVVRNADGNYLVRDNGSYTWEANKENATRFVSGEDGSFHVSGLKFGRYHLEEVKAPRRYVLPNASVPFEIKNGTFNPRARMAIVNRPVQPGRLPITGGKEEPQTPVKPRLPITRGEERPRLPRTGEINNMILSAVGIMLITSALVILNTKNEKRGKTNEKID